MCGKCTSGYGFGKTELTKLLRKRLIIKEKLRYHTKKLEQFKSEIEDIEAELERYQNFKTLTW